MSQNDVVIVIDFGSPYNQKLTRKIRELGVYSELYPHTITLEQVQEINPRAIILSGGPYFVDDEGAPKIDARLYDSGIPMLGICYGAQLIARQFGGGVIRERERKYLEDTINIQETSTLYEGISGTQEVLLSEGDVIIRTPRGFTVNSNESLNMVSFSNDEKRIYGVLYYPEVETTTHGEELLKNFLFPLAAVV